MQTNEMISTEQICIHHRITRTFLQSLGEYGLVRITRTETEEECVPAEEMRGLERLIRLHHDLDLDAEALDLVAGLLGRIEALQEKLAGARRQLKAFQKP